MPSLTKLATALLSDVGLVRDNNEDAVAQDRNLGLLVLADGMGGYSAGEVAASIATMTVLDHVRHAWPSLQPGAIDPDSGLRSQSLLLKKAIEHAHHAICNVAQTQAHCAGMGTTLVACIVHDNCLSIAYVGDSRLYRLHDGQFDLLTTDHSLMEEMISRGYYSRAEAAQHVRKNIVTRALGVEDEVQVDLLEESVEHGDVLLLCSDGLTDMVEDASIAYTMSSRAGDLEQAAQALISQALDAGGKDNVSVVLAQVWSAGSRERDWTNRLREWF